MQCQLCEREVARLTEHHLIPRQATKRDNKRTKKRSNTDLGPTIAICSPCHRQIHKLFDNATLARDLNTRDRLRRDPQLQAFLRWIRKQTPDKHVRVR